MVSTIESPQNLYANSPSRTRADKNNLVHAMETLSGGTAQSSALFLLHLSLCPNALWLLSARMKGLPWCLSHSRHSGGT